MPARGARASGQTAAAAAGARRIAVKKGSAGMGGSSARLTIKRG